MKLVALAFVLAVAALSAADVSGNWTIEGEIANNAVNFACTLKQDGDKLSGAATIEGKEIFVTGTVKEKIVSFTFDVEYQGQTYTNVYTGTLKEERVIEGTIEVAGITGPFKAKKQ
jgi:hypothetical protein